MTATDDTKHILSLDLGSLYAGRAAGALDRPDDRPGSNEQARTRQAQTYALVSIANSLAALATVARVLVDQLEDDRNGREKIARPATRITIPPTLNWNLAVKKAIGDAPLGSTLVVPSSEACAIGRSLAYEMERDDLTFEIDSNASKKP